MSKLLLLRLATGAAVAGLLAVSGLPAGARRSCASA